MSIVYKHDNIIMQGMPRNLEDLVPEVFTAVCSMYDYREVW